MPLSSSKSQKKAKLSDEEEDQMPLTNEKLSAAKSKNSDDDETMDEAKLQ